MRRYLSVCLLAFLCVFFALGTSAYAAEKYIFILPSLGNPYWQTVKQGIEERLAAFEAELQQMEVKGRQATLIARKLEWCCERKNAATIDLV